MSQQLFEADMRILIDSREQKPYSFTIPSETGTVSIGDYTIKGLEDCVGIERKELDDLIACLTQGRERFERELHKGRALDYFALVVEASLSDIVNGHYQSSMTAKSAMQSLLAFSVRYRLSIFFCENHAYAQRVTESLLCKYARELEKKAILITKQ